MTKRRGDYNGGSTVLSATGHGFSHDPAAPNRKYKRAKPDPFNRSYSPPPFTAAEEAENARLRAQMMGPPGLITREQMLREKRPRPTIVPRAKKRKKGKGGPSA